MYNFVLDQMFAAKKEGGATMNGEPIHVSTCTGQSMICEGISQDLVLATDKTQALVLTALGHARSEQLLRQKLDAILELAKNPSPVHG